MSCLKICNWKFSKKKRSLIGGVVATGMLWDHLTNDTRLNYCPAVQFACWSGCGFFCDGDGRRRWSSCRGEASWNRSSDHQPFVGYYLQYKIIIQLVTVIFHWVFENCLGQLILTEGLDLPLSLCKLHVNGFINDSAVLMMTIDAYTTGIMQACS